MPTRQFGTSLTSPRSVWIHAWWSEFDLDRSQCLPQIPSNVTANFNNVPPQRTA